MKAGQIVRYVGMNEELTGMEGEVVSVGTLTRVRFPPFTVEWALSNADVKSIRSYSKAFAATHEVPWVKRTDPGRSGTAMTPADHRAKGKRSLQLWIPPEISAALDRILLAMGRGATIKELICELILERDRKIVMRRSK